MKSLEIDMREYYYKKWMKRIEKMMREFML